MDNKTNRTILAETCQAALAVGLGLIKLTFGTIRYLSQAVVDLCEQKQPSGKKKKDNK